MFVCVVLTFEVQVSEARNPNAYIRAYILDSVCYFQSFVLTLQFDYCIREKPIQL